MYLVTTPAGFRNSVTSDQDTVNKFVNLITTSNKVAYYCGGVVMTRWLTCMYKYISWQLPI